jgi:transposase
MQALILSKKEKKEVLSFIRKTKKAREYKRAKAVLMVADGYKMRETARILDVHYNMVGDCIARYRNGGINSLVDAPRSGRPPKIKPKHLKHLKEVIRKTPHLLGYDAYWWNCRLLAQEIKKVFRVEITDEWVRRLMNEQGYGFRRPKLHISSPDPEYDIKKTL